MGLTNKKEEQLRQMPLIKNKISKSKDGRFLIHRTELINIKPMAYYEAILKNNEQILEETDEDLKTLVEQN
ncbi:hypothetical protein KO361_05500 [Candidatus Woesearchaeota archaeon]|jgi:hypothetical protein|nr:hypothetical protein [Candidatus Woesearchaeota archaeon]